MNKRHNLAWIIAITIIIATLSISACTADTPSPALSSVETPDQEVVIETLDEAPGLETVIETIEEEPLETPTEPEPTIPEPVQDLAEPLTNTSNLTDLEIESLVFMREEEKLAHDVYLALYEIWGLPLFDNIASSEQTHTDAVKNLLVRFDIPDPADTSPAGIFVNAELQQLFDELTLTGAESLENALKVGAAIEEIDILDLQEALEIIQDASIRRVYENLLRGSENHLRAFTSTLARQTGEIYEPQYMDETDYNATVNSENERGGRGNNQRP